MPRIFRVYKKPPLPLQDPLKFGRPSIGLAPVGCRNRPFFHICVFPDKVFGRRWTHNVIEQVGTFDPVPNFRNEKIVALNVQKIIYWIGVRNAEVSTTVLELLGIGGLLPLHPKTILDSRSIPKQREEHYEALRAIYREKEFDKKFERAKEIAKIRKV